MPVAPRCVAQCRIDTPLGPMTLAATAAGLAGAWFDDQAHHPGPLAVPVDANQVWLQRAKQHLASYFAGRAQPVDLPLDPKGTPWQRAVWAQLQRIPAGTTCPYGELACALGRPGAARAVGAAVARNPISLIVPCHRVLGRGGQLTGYAGGLARKRALLTHEARSATAPAPLTP